MSPLWRRAALLLALCIILAVVASSAQLHAALIQVLSSVNDVIGAHPIAGTLLFVLLAAVSAMFAFVSVAVVTPALVFAWGEPLTLLLLWTGWILGGVGTYCVGRYFGRPTVSWLSKGQGLQRFEHRIQRNAPFWTVVLLQLALPSEIPGYLLGLARYPFRTYALALGLAELPYSFATVHLGGSLLQHSGNVVLITGVAIAALSIVALYTLRHMMRESAGDDDKSSSRSARRSGTGIVPRP
jgi:uncharacterized membrane protein YdjX (TVP38/TMEM64 family)